MYHFYACSEQAEPQNASPQGEVRKQRQVRGAQGWAAGSAGCLSLKASGDGPKQGQGDQPPAPAAQVGWVGQRPGRHVPTPCV